MNFYCWLAHSMMVYFKNQDLRNVPCVSSLPAELWPFGMRPAGGEPARLQREGRHLRGDADAAAHVAERQITPVRRLGEMGSVTKVEAQPISSCPVPPFPTCVEQVVVTHTRSFPPPPS